ncbi:MAG: 50S ribosomal protein L31 [Planctomycetota bacterium]
MKKGIHPELNLLEVHQTDGSMFMTRSTSKAKKISLDVDSKSHPAFTGESRIIDTTGRVERFQKRFAWDQSKMEEAKKTKKVEVGELAQLTASKQIKVPRIIEQKRPQFGKDGKPIQPKDAPAKDGAPKAAEGKAEKAPKAEKTEKAPKAEKPAEAKAETPAEEKKE